MNYTAKPVRSLGSAESDIYTQWTRKNVAVYFWL